jgi:hypothetical protein
MNAPAQAGSSRGLQEYYLALCVLGQRSFRESFQVEDASAYRKIELASEDDRGEGLPGPLASHRLHDQILVLAEDHPAQFTRSE